MANEDKRFKVKYLPHLKEPIPNKLTVHEWAEKYREPGAYCVKPEKPFDYLRLRHPATDLLVYARQGARCDGLYLMSEKKVLETICVLRRGCVDCGALCSMRMFQRTFKKVYRGRRRIQRLKIELMKPKQDRIIIGKMCVMKSATPGPSSILSNPIMFDDNSGGD